MVILCGDFFQIPPVCAECIFMDPSKSKHKTTFLGKLGYDLWKGIQHVVILKENMRHSEDESYAFCLKRLRRGECTKEDIEMFNTRVFCSAKMMGKLDSSSFSGTVPLVVRGNETRMALNWKCVKELSLACGRKPIVCVAKIFSGNWDVFMETDMKKLLACNDTQTSNLSPLLPLLPGMPVRVTMNVSVDICIANGTEGTLVGIEFEEGTGFDETVIFDVECVIPSRMPVACFVLTPSCQDALPRRFKTVPSHYPDGTIPLIPATSRKFKTSLKIWVECAESLQLTQFPFVPSFASTTYKVQGITSDGVTAFPFFKGCSVRPPRASMYVVLSRVRSLDSLYLFEKITEEQVRFFTPSFELLSEEKRLEKMHNETCCRKVSPEQQ